ncbi:MAG TPA: tRNA glutamyl-Q(34) synthetase GluQRS [Phycisphaerae bacterium]|nr:tRNA glutamyl-Q(34) synthetase GluQRS [Phycisphaerae bacterium]
MPHQPLIFRATRLAPSPTGALHLGHARTFLVSWWMARQAGARVFMRMEDLDAGRARPESVRQAYDDLRWLGITWDAYPGEAGDGEVVQSRRGRLYAAALENLWEREAIYPCTCTRADIAAAVAGSASAPHEGDAGPRYPGTCAGGLVSRAQCPSVELAERTVREHTRRPACWRLRVPKGPIAFDDLIAGPRAMHVSRDAGDFPLTRFDGTPAYQLACVVDDHHMGIDLVVRGDDLLPSTPRQLALYRALGWMPPQFAHVPLVIGADGKRLAKRHGESRIAQFRAAGISPRRIVGWAAWRSGQIDSLREVNALDLVSGFDFSHLPKTRVVLEEPDLAWLAGQ